MRYASALPLWRSHLIGLYDARLDQCLCSPPWASSHDAIGGHYQHKVDLVSMFKEFAG
jgi:hypothetical protein